MYNERHFDQVTYIDKILLFQTSYYFRKYGLITNLIKSGESGPP